MANPICAISCITCACFQQLHVDRGHVQHSNLLVVKHVCVEFDPGLLVKEKVFL